MWWSSLMKTGKKTYFLNRRNYCFKLTLRVLALHSINTCVTLRSRSCDACLFKCIGKSSTPMSFNLTLKIFVLSLRWYLRICKMLLRVDRHLGRSYRRGNSCRERYHPDLKNRVWWALILHVLLFLIFRWFLSNPTKSCHDDYNFFLTNLFPQMSVRTTISIFYVHNFVCRPSHTFCDERFYFLRNHEKTNI